jgi:hypothetical protein
LSVTGRFNACYILLYTVALKEKRLWNTNVIDAGKSIN